MSLNGFDIANVNGAGIIDRALTGSFTILKASEGTGFRDGYHDGWAARLRSAGKLVGHYHYAHLANSPTAEADWFVRCAKPQAGDTMWLDFEPYGQAVSDASFPSWAIAFLDRVNASVPGVSCGIYLNDDMGHRMMAHANTVQAARLHQAPLWKAAYSLQPGSLLGWGNLTAWQWSGTGIDADVFYGDANTWRILGAGHHTVTPGKPPQDTPPPQDAPPPQPAPPALTGDDMLGYLFRCSDGRVVFVGVSGVTRVANTTDLSTLYAMGFGYGPKQEAISANKTWSAADAGPFDMFVKQQGGLK